jgi:lipopolysaccharide/colanic/teichoic acid biosynthesis glycosyltransferase
VIDVIGSSLAILLLTPVLLTTAIAVKLTSEGPIIYHQLRCSKHGKLFRIYKLRSMRVGAEKDKPVWAVGNDPRCTPIGNFLRRTCLDELVQFFNVLKGDLSLVGPRPERPYFIQQFKKKLPTYLERLNVKAGMTGWAQVHGLNGDTSVEERLKYDLFYVQNWSLLFDLKILLLTIPFLFKQVVKR